MPRRLGSMRTPRRDRAQRVSVLVEILQPGSLRRYRTEGAELEIEGRFTPTLPEAGIPDWAWPEGEWAADPICKLHLYPEHSTERLTWDEAMDLVAAEGHGPRAEQHVEELANEQALERMAEAPTERELDEAAGEARMDELREEGRRG